MAFFVNKKLLKLFLIYVSAFTVPCILYSQTTTVPGAPVYRDIKAYDDHLTITNNEGGPFKNSYESIEGSPFFIDHYCLAHLKLNKGKEYQNIPVKLNLYTQEIVLIDGENKEIVPVDGLVTNINFTDTTEGISHVYKFRSDYPPVDKNNSFTFYQVLSDGRLQLLKHIWKEIVEEKNIQSGEIRKTFIMREEYYIFSNGEMRKLKKNKEYVEELMKDQQQKISQYEKEKKINFKNITSLAGLFDYYNSLPPLKSS